jgi:hypothetical protein
MIQTENQKLHKTIQRLEYICDTLPEQLAQISEKDFSWRPAPGKWSKKEILGHLIDSANNNHQRFVRGQFQSAPAISYEQNNWVSNNHYQEMTGEVIINLWSAYNRFLVSLMRRIPEENLKRTCVSDGTREVTLEWLMVDYVRHLEHHLAQIVTL